MCYWAVMVVLEELTLNSELTARRQLWAKLIYQWGCAGLHVDPFTWSCKYVSVGFSVCACVCVGCKYIFRCSYLLQFGDFISWTFAFNGVITTWHFLWTPTAFSLPWLHVHVYHSLFLCPISILELHSQSGLIRQFFCYFAGRISVSQQCAWILIMPVSDWTVHSLRVNILTQ